MLSAHSHPVTWPPAAPQPRAWGVGWGGGRRGSREVAFPDLQREELPGHTQQGKDQTISTCLLCSVSGKETKAGCSAISDLQTLRR